MNFNPGLSIGQTIKNSDLIDIFHCGSMGGMRRSHATNTLVIVTDYTKGIYHDKWIGGVLHYTGMGKNGDQDINWAQNATLAEINNNDVDVHLFEVIEEGEYIYCGRVELASEPYTETQPGENGIDRLVWIFPVRPIPDNDVVKPNMFVFKDMEDYKKNGKGVDQKYAELMAQQKKSKSSNGTKKSSGIVGRTITHNSYGEGTISKYDGTFITVKFVKYGVKMLNYQLCLDKALIQFI